MARAGFLALFVACVAAAGSAGANATAAEPTAGDLARSLQKRYASIYDFSADFVHSYQGGVLRKTITERGHLLVKKPGKMRWEYSAPDQKLFVSDGVKMYSYLPQDKQVIVGTVPPDDEATSPALFLAGKGDLTRDFTPSLVAASAGMPEGTRSLKLVPKKPQGEYEWLTLEVDPATLGLRGLVTVDAEGGTSTFTFSNLKENTGLSDKPFTFKIPRGVDVVSGSSD